MDVKKFCFLCFALLFAATSVASDYEDSWGPAVGSEFPQLAVKDVDGKDRTIEDLTGEKRGLLLFFVRSADW